MSDPLPFFPDIKGFPSPHQSDRNGHGVQGVVVHYTGDGSALSSISWMQNGNSRVSAHFVISREGEIYQLVPLDKAAWHAGNAEMGVPSGEVISAVNSSTIGVELANWGMLQGNATQGWYSQIRSMTYPYKGEEPVKAELHYDTGEIITGWWEPYPDMQIEALKRLRVALAMQGYAEPAYWWTGHQDVCIPRTRKKDPGPLFPWDLFSYDYQRTSHKLLGGLR